MSAKIQNILCPTDFSDHAALAMEYAETIAVKFKARLHLHHAVALPDLTLAHEMGPQVAAAREAAQTFARSRLREIADRLAATKIETVTHLTVGSPSEDILTIVKEHAIDLVVIGSHGRGAIKQMLLGGTTEKIIRLSTCAVLTVRKPGHAYVAP